MEDIKVQPGHIVVTDFGVYQHWSLVSDRIGSDGKLMLISATRRLGTVAEELWDTVTQGRRTYVVEADIKDPLPIVLQRARDKIGEWKYELNFNNCEHFAKWAGGLEVSSTQVKAGVTGAVVGAAAVALLSEDPKLIKFLTGAFLVGGVAVMAAKAVGKRKKPERSEAEMIEL